MQVSALVVVAAFSCWSGPAFAHIPDKPDFVGVLEIRSLDTASGSASFKPSIVRREEPTMRASSVGEIDRIDSVETFEWSYESIGLAVYGYIHDGKRAWYKIYVPERRDYAWITGRESLGFRGLSQLVANSLSYLTKDWDGTVYSDPSEPESFTVLAAPEDEVPIEIASTARVDGEIWLLVVVLKESPCSSTEAPTVLGAGWVPALSANRLLNVWFHSRGC